jgi:uncharacterized membrane protein YwzB
MQYIPLHQIQQNEIRKRQIKNRNANHTVRNRVPAIIISLVVIGPIFSNFFLANLGASGLDFTVGG